MKRYLDKVKEELNISTEKAVTLILAGLNQQYNEEIDKKTYVTTNEGQCLSIYPITQGISKERSLEEKVYFNLYENLVKLPKIPDRQEINYIIRGLSNVTGYHIVFDKAVYRLTDNPNTIPKRLPLEQFLVHRISKYITTPGVNKVKGIETVSSFTLINKIMEETQVGKEYTIHSKFIMHYKSIFNDEEEKLNGEFEAKFSLEGGDNILNYLKFNFKGV